METQDNSSVYNKLNIALEYIDLAIDCYVGGNNYFCAIHLAGAAEELLGQWLAEKERHFSHAVKAEKQLRTIDTGVTPSDKDVKYYLNFSKNSIKHMDDGNPHIYLDPIIEARWWIEAALSNFYKTGLPKSAKIWSFEDFRNSETQR